MPLFTFSTDTINADSCRFDSLDGRSALRIAQTDPFVAVLFQLIQEERKQNELRAHTYRGLQELEVMLSQIQGAEELRASYREKMTTTAANNLIDKFTVSVMDSVKALCGVPDLVPVDSECVRAFVEKAVPAAGTLRRQDHELTMIDGEDNSGDDMVTDDEMGSSDAHDSADIAIPGISRDWNDVDGLPEEVLLQDEVEAYYRSRRREPIYYPGWKCPQKGPVSINLTSAAADLDASQSQEADIPLHSHAIPACGTTTNGTST